MADLRLKIVCPDGQIFDGEAKSILLTTTEGEVQLLRGHAAFAAPLATGRAKLVMSDSAERLAAVSGGFVVCDADGVRVVATTFEFADTIDLERAMRAKEEAERRISAAKDERELDIAKAKLSRAISRISVAGK